MKPCTKHWAMMRAAVDSRGMGDLVAQSAEEAAKRIQEELDGGKPKFEPRLSMHWHWMNNALRHGGLYMMNVDTNANPENEGHFCPVCEFEKHIGTFDAEAEINAVADSMRAHCIKEGLIPKPN